MNSWYVYILLCEGDKLYTGIARDVTARFTLHQAGKGAKYTMRNKPVKIVYTEEHDSMSSARLREVTIKKMSRAQKDVLLEQNIPLC
ncbi:MAG: GIY-YIG nuclease family protein [Patescibacteria group bacterium]